MIELSQPEIARLRAADVAVAGSCRGEDATWLAVMVGVTALEASWWGVTWLMGIAPAPYLFTYLALSFAGLACALILRFALEPRAEISKWSTIVPATFSIGIGASLFLPLKYAIPKLTPFWLDQPLAHAERAIFAGDPWLLLDRFFGWAAVPMDRLYGLWLPTQALVLFLVISQPGSAAKSRALVAYVLAWFLLGVAAAALLSSAGPIFYDQLFGGTEFVALRELLQHRGAWVVLAEFDRMWASGQWTPRNYCRNFCGAVDPCRNQRVDDSSGEEHGAPGHLLRCHLRRCDLDRLRATRMALCDRRADGRRRNVGHLAA